jgi:hypothetical protein
MMHNFKKWPKKTNAPSNNIANVLPLNVWALTTKPTRLKGKMWFTNETTTPCVHNHMHTHCEDLCRVEHQPVM